MTSGVKCPATQRRNFALHRDAICWKLNQAFIQSACRGSSRPYIVLRLLQVSREDIHGLPSARAHDGGRVKAACQKILRSADPHRVTAEGGDVGGVEPGPFRGLLHEP